MTPEELLELFGRAFDAQRASLALLDAQVTDGDEVTVDVRGRRESFVVTKPPFVTPTTT